ncbi:unnamed protein product [Sphenostylis stenocarpa]|uniref:Serine aminopeptidase S33 domain-containing protein n=1 Tax=Sphenostylis stenocarpa TaxID=92480 RepID=A0AA86SQ65_9FABA|nr:unnamed protein product [Sphenostylis stenocarpa]
MEENLDGVTPCSSVAVEAIIRVGAAGAIWGLCAGPYDARQQGLTGIAKASFVANSVSRSGIRCGFLAGIFSVTRCGVQKYRGQNDWSCLTIRDGWSQYCLVITGSFLPDYRSWISRALLLAQFCQFVCACVRGRPSELVELIDCSTRSVMTPCLYTAEHHHSLRVDQWQVMRCSVNGLIGGAVTGAAAAAATGTRNWAQMIGMAGLVYMKKSKELQLFTCRWVPFSTPKAIVFLCHGANSSLSPSHIRCKFFSLSRILGYAMECSTFMRECGERLASAGYAVFGIDYEGHGRSGGVRCFITRFDDIVDDCENFFRTICGKQLSEKLIKQSAIIVNVMTKFEDIIPKWKIVPTKNIIDSAFKNPAKKQAIRNNKLIYQDKPRLKTAMEMIRASSGVGDILHEVTLPFIVLQGEDDTVTDPTMSKELYERANCEDKTIKLYKGMCHGIASGESDENIALVYRDIIDWLDDHSYKPHFVYSFNDSTFGSRASSIHKSS